MAAYTFGDLSLGSTLPNGAIVISYDIREYDDGISADTALILAMQPGNMTPYITWMAFGDDLRSTAMGHYHSALDAALADFNERHEAYGFGEE